MGAGCRVYDRAPERLAQTPAASPMAWSPYIPAMSPSDLPHVVVPHGGGLRSLAYLAGLLHLPGSPPYTAIIGAAEAHKMR